MNNIVSLNNLKLCALGLILATTLSSCFISMTESKHCPYKEAKAACDGGCQKACAKVKEMEAEKAAMEGKKSCGCNKEAGKCTCADKKSCGCGDKGQSCGGKM